MTDPAQNQPMPALDVGVATRLITDQFPALAGRDVRPMPHLGTDNHIFLIGDDLCARFPKVPWAARTAAREVAALPRFAAAPVAVPQVYGLGAPAEEFQYPWSVLSWLPGGPLENGTLPDAAGTAQQLADFFLFIRSIPPEAGFAFGPDNNNRGAPLPTRSDAFHAALGRLPDFPGDWARRLWADALRAGTSSSPAWLHGDVHPGNVLLSDGRPSGIIDWGLCGVGDAACDLLSAWAMFDREPREVFRRTIGASDADWLRGAGWALSMAVIYLPYAYENALPSDMSERMIARLKEEFA